MADESTADAVSEIVSDAVAEPAKTSEAVADVDTTDGAESEALEGGDEGDQEDAPEEIEFDYGGTKLRVAKDAIPDEIAGKLDQYLKTSWANHTRNSQANAETKQSLEARERALQQMGTISDDLLDTFSYGKQLRREVDALSKVDWNALWRDDPDRARQLSDLQRQKDNELQSVVSQVASKEQALTQAQTAEVDRRMAEGRAQVEKHVKGFDTKASEVVDYVVKTFGFSKEQAEKWPLNPATAVMAYKAMQFDQLQAKTAQAAKPKTAAPANPVMPVVKGKTATRPYDLNRDAEKLSADEWMRRRNAEIAKRANA